MKRRIALLLAGLLLAGAVRGESVITVQSTGSAANRVDLVILGDGYTAADQDDFSADVERAVEGLFAQPPFSAYRGYFNVHRIEVLSAQGGADHPEAEPPSFRATALGASFNCSDIERLICVDHDAVHAVLDRSVAPDQRDIILVLVNDPQYGGSGGSIAVASRHPEIIELVLHELGHSFGLLGDEYDYGPPECVDGLEPWQANIARDIDRLRLKWNAGGGPPRGWVGETVPLPTASGTLDRIGAFEGARYCVSGLYRPTFDSKMRNLNRPFDAINSEQLVKRIYNLVSPIDASSPRHDIGVILAVDERRRFRVQVPTSAEPLQVSWSINGRKVGSGSGYTLRAANLGTGVHVLRADVSDPTSRVRNDPENLLQERREWTIAIGLQCNGLGPTLVGTQAADRLAGTARADVILGLGGDDQIEGRGGDDVVCGGTGADTLLGGAGADQLFGGPGADQCSGGGGTDRANSCESQTGFP